MPWEDDLRQAIMTADVVITDGPGIHAERLVDYRVTAALLDHGPEAIRLAPCPPFVRGREIGPDAVEHRAFVGYGFKRHLLPGQQAVLSLVLQS